MSATLPSMLTVLLDAGLAVDEREEPGCTPLWYAARSNKMEYVKLLLARGADPNVRAGQDLKSVYEVARPRGELTLLALLRDAGAVTAQKAPVGPKALNDNDPFHLGA